MGTQLIHCLLMVADSGSPRFLVIAPFWLPCCGAIIVVSAAWDQFSDLSSRLGGHRWFGCQSIVGVMMLFIMVPLVLASVEFAQQLTHLAQELQQQIESGRLAGVTVVVTKICRLYREWLQIQWAAFSNRICK